MPALTSAGPRLLALLFLGVALLAGTALVKGEIMRTFVFLSALATMIILVAAPTESAFAQKATAGQKVDIGTCRQLAREKCRFQRGMGACNRAAVARCKEGGPSAI